MMTAFLLASLQLSWAETKIESESTADSIQSSKLIFEAGMLAQSMREANSPLIGPTALYQISDKFSLGARAMLSLSGKSYESAYTFQILQRVNVYQSEGMVFVEINESYNQAHRAADFLSLGSSLGLTYPLTQKIGFGGSAGIEYDLDEKLLYPKVTTFLSLAI